MFFGTSYGIILLIKIILVIMTLITYIVHVKLLNEKIEKKIMGSDTGNVYVQSIRSRIIYLGRITVIMSLVILLLASLLRPEELSNSYGCVISKTQESDDVPY